MRNDSMINELLNAWEETYKKGQLTFWVFLALKDSNKCVEDIKEFVEKMSDGSMSCEEQSLYRNLRKFQHLEIVAYDSKRVSKGPDRKYYYLTDIGKLVQIKMIAYFEFFIRIGISLRLQCGKGNRNKQR